MAAANFLFPNAKTFPIPGDLAFVGSFLCTLALGAGESPAIGRLLGDLGFDGGAAHTDFPHPDFTCLTAVHPTGIILAFNHNLDIRREVLHACSSPTVIGTVNGQRCNLVLATILGNWLPRFAQGWLDRDRSIPVTVFGHGFAGCMAQMVAMYIKRTLGFQNVSCVTYGAPAAGGPEFRFAFTGNIPAWWNVRLYGDEMVRMPPALVWSNPIGLAFYALAYNYWQLPYDDIIGPDAGTLLNDSLFTNPTVYGIASTGLAQWLAYLNRIMDLPVRAFPWWRYNGTAEYFFDNVIAPTVLRSSLIADFARSVRLLGNVARIFHIVTTAVSLTQVADVLADLNEVHQSRTYTRVLRVDAATRPTANNLQAVYDTYQAFNAPRPPEVPDPSLANALVPILNQFFAAGGPLPPVAGSATPDLPLDFMSYDVEATLAVAGGAETSFASQALFARSISAAGGELAGNAAARPWWLFRGTDRRILQKLQTALRLISERDFAAAVKATAKGTAPRLFINRGDPVVAAAFSELSDRVDALLQLEHAAAT